MRDFINRVRSLRVLPALFHGTHADKLEVGDDGLLLTDFDHAASRGRYVYECEVDLQKGYDQPVFEDDNKVRIFDESRLNVLNRYDTHCPEPLDEDATRRMLLEFTPNPGSHVCLVTGKLARAGLERVMHAIAPEDFTYEIRALDIAVAAWLNIDLIRDGIGPLDGVDLIMLPGKVTGDEGDLARELGVPVQRGPTCYSELPEFLERAGVELTNDVVKPKVVFIGAAGAIYGQEIASTYEIPYIRAADLVRDGVLDDDETAILAVEFVKRGEPVPHFYMAELVRARLITAPNGFVLDGYPATVRDVEWLATMTQRVDAVVALTTDTGELIDHYAESPALVLIDPSSSMARSDLFTKLEAMFQRCVSSNIEQVSA